MREVLDVAVAVANALGEAHANGVIHRDVKPENIVLTHRGHPKVMDFGLAKQVGAGRNSSAATTKLTAEGVAMGTVAYMSPEQAVGKEVDAGTDVFSFGSKFLGDGIDGVLWCALSARRPLWTFRPPEGRLCRPRPAGCLRPAARKVVGGAPGGRSARVEHRDQHRTCLLGNMGSEKRVEYTAIGSAVNEAFRLCRQAKPGEIRIGGRTHDDVHEDVRVEPVRVDGDRGKRDRSHAVIGLKYLS